MSKEFMIQVTLVLVLAGLIAIFPDSFGKGYEYLSRHEYIFIIIFDTMLIVLFALAKYNLKIKQSLFVLIALTIIGLASLIYSYFYEAKYPVYIMISALIAYGIYIGKQAEKITKTRDCETTK